jgi:hypothetical protein
MRCRWLLWLVAAELVAQQLHWGVALGGIGSVGISGTAAMLSNPAGLCAQPTRWELALPAAWLRLEGLQLSEYAFYFGGVETPQGWQRRRLSLSERNEFAQLLETHGLEAWLLLQVLGLPTDWIPLPLLGLRHPALGMLGCAYRAVPYRHCSRSPLAPLR